MRGCEPRCAFWIQSTVDASPLKQEREKAEADQASRWFHEPLAERLHVLFQTRPAVYMSHTRTAVFLALHVWNRNLKCFSPSKSFRFGFSAPRLQRFDVPLGGRAARPAAAPAFPARVWMCTRCATVTATRLPKEGVFVVGLWRCLGYLVDQFAEHKTDILTDNIELLLHWTESFVLFIF